MKMCDYVFKVSSTTRNATGWTSITNKQLQFSLKLATEPLLVSLHTKAAVISSSPFYLVYQPDVFIDPLCRSESAGVQGSIWDYGI